MSTFATDTSPVVSNAGSRINPRADVSTIPVALAVAMVCIPSLVIVTENSIILAAFYNYKRLRTASNCLLVSLAISDLGVGMFIPIGMWLELSGVPENGRSALCIAPYCVAIALCSASVLVTGAIAFDRLMSLARPLRYKNIITHSNIEMFIAVFWVYAIVAGLSPMIYPHIIGVPQTHGGTCRFDSAVLPPVRVFLVIAVWVPSALVVLGCYIYVYLVARSHARAIYTVERFGHQLVLPRYGQTLAVTVGVFLVLWLPFQMCMLVDIYYDTNLLSEWAVIWLGLLILAHSGINPWIYAFHHGEMRAAAGKIAGNMMTFCGIVPSRYLCSSGGRRGSRMNLELVEVNNSNDARRYQVENCFAAKHHSVVCASRRCLEISSKHADISPEKNDGSRQSDIVEEDIHDLTKMLDPKYIIDRNHVIDSNHNIDKMRNAKYLLDPTFNKIRHLRRLNHKRLASKNFAKFAEPKFISYQNLQTDGGTLNPKQLQLNTMSDPMLNTNSPVIGAKGFNDALCHNPALCKRRNSNLSSVSDPDIKGTTGHTSEINLRLVPPGRNSRDIHRYSVQNLDHSKYESHLIRHAVIGQQIVENQRRLNVYHRTRAKPPCFADSPSPPLNLQLQNSYVSLSTPDSASPELRNSPKQWCTASRHITITTNKLANLVNAESKKKRNHRHRLTDPVTAVLQPDSEVLKHSESINVIEPIARTKLLEPSKLVDTLAVPTIHSEPPSPIEPFHLASLQEEDVKSLEATKPSAERTSDCQRSEPSTGRSLVRHSSPIIPSVSLNVEEIKENCDWDDKAPNNNNNELPSNSPTINPIDLFEALLRNSERSRENRLPEPIFTEHDSTKFSSRRPSDSKWSESSRSQEILSNVAEHQSFPSSYSVNNFSSCTSGSDLNDLTCLDPFMCPDALTSSLRESLFGAPSVPDSDFYTSFEEANEATSYSPDPPSPKCPSPITLGPSASPLTLKKPTIVEIDRQSRSSESVFHNGSHSSATTTTLLRLQPPAHRNMSRERSCKDCVLRDNLLKRNPRLAPLAMPTPTDVCTPTFDVVAEIQSDDTLGVRV